MNTSELTLGTEIYNTGDSANPCHFGTITNILHDGQIFEITPEDPEINKYRCEWFNFSPEFHGNCSTRLVTREAWERWYAEKYGKTTEVKS